MSASVHEDPRFVITSKQLVFLLIGNVVATGILSLSRLASADAKQDAWISVLVGAFVPLVSLWLITTLGKRHKGHNLVEIAHLLFGKVGGTLLLLTLLGNMLVYIAAVAGNFAVITHIYILPNTPRKIILVVIMLSTLYVMSKGIQVVARVNEFFFYVMLTLALIYLTAFSQFDITNLLPVGGAAITGIVRGALKTSFAYGGIDILLVVYSMVRRQDEIMKASLISLVVIASVYIMVTVVDLLVYGATELQDLMYPGLYILKAVDFAVVERLEFFYLMFWMGWGVRPVFTTGAAAGYILTLVLKRDLKRFYFLSTAIIALLSLAVAWLPGDIDQVTKLSDLAGMLFLVFALGYPLLFLVASFLRRGEVTKAA